MKNTKLLNIVYFIIIFVLCCTFVWVEYIFINQIRDDINSIGCFLGIFHPTIFIGVTEVIALPFVCYYSNKTRIKSVILFMLATAVALMYNIYNEWIISRSILNIIVMTFVWGYPSLMITAFFGDIENNFKISHAITDENLVQAELLIDILEVLTFNEICIGVVMKNSNCSLFYLPISYYNEKFCKFAKSQNGVFECPYFDDRIYNAIRNVYNGECFIPLNKRNTKSPKSYLPVILFVKPVWLCTRTENSPIEDVPDKNTVVRLNIQKATNVHVIIAIGITVKRTGAAQNMLRFLMTIDCL